MRAIVFGFSLLLVNASVALAEMRAIASAGAWNAYGGRTRSGEASCALATSLSGGRSIFLQLFEGERDRLVIRHVRDSWRIPDGTRIPISMQIDGFPPWAATALGSGNEARSTVTLASIGDFETEFRRGLTMRIVFREGNEPSWTVSLAGTNAVMNAFVACIRAILAPPTQPFNGRPSTPTAPSIPTQPFGSPSASATPDVPTQRDRRSAPMPSHRPAAAPASPEFMI